MKKLFLFALGLFMITKLFGQSQGINYQAVIIDMHPQEVPGPDVSENILPNHTIIIRFSVLNSAGTIDYQEEQETTTDAYGMINLTIGKGTQTISSPGSFADIDWNGTPKALKVDISFSNIEVFFTDFSYQELSFVPYAYHKNITATGTLDVDGSSTLKSRLSVSNGSPVFLSGNLTVDEFTTLQKDLTVNAASDLKGQVTINTNVSGDKSNYESYPLRVEGSNQGVAVRITGSRSSNNNFVTFWDDENIQGRIEGQTSTDLLNDPEYIFDNVMFGNEVLRSTVDVAKAVAGVVSASTSSTVCVGLGACVTSPVPSLIAGAIAEVAMETANLALGVAAPVLYNVYKHANIGVTYQSGAGDYAEWLLKADPAEKFLPGDIVGVSGGTISRSTENAGNYMVISLNPIVLGNMPERGKEHSYEKVAFMGQVPVKVFGKVNIGDYIVPSGRNNGAGVAVSRGDIQPEQYPQIVGIAWSGTELTGYNYVNVAVGLQANDVAMLNMKQEQKIRQQEKEIDGLKEQLNQMNVVLARMVPGYAELLQNGEKMAPSSGGIKQDQQYLSGEKTVIYYGVSKDEINEGIALAEKTLIEKGIDISKNPFFTKLKTDPAYKDNFITELQNSIEKELDATSEKDIKSGANVIRLQ
jgi:hypothetical protein